MTYIVNLNELTAVYLLGLMLARRKVYILDVDPIVPPLRSVLRRLAEWAVRRKRAEWIIELVPALRPIWRGYARILLFDIFARTESWQNAYFEFARAEQAVPDYAMAYKQQTCNYTKQNHLQYLLIAAALRALPDGVARFVGLRADMLAGLEAYQQRRLSPALRAMRLLHAPINAATTLAITVYALAQVAARIRLTPPAAEKFFFAADYIADPRDFALYHEVAEGGPLLLVARDADEGAEKHAELRAYRACLSTEGFFRPLEALGQMCAVVGDGLRLFWQFRRCPPPHFYRIATLPHKRMILSAFFNRYQPRFYWGRDDYNVEHIFRREALHRVGGVSLGINHGFPAYAIVFPMWRYISFDRYYVFGRAIYDVAMKETWASDMKVIPVGSFGATRKDYARRFAARSRDIAVYSAVFVGDPRMIRFVRELAHAFPDRKIMLQLKRQHVATEDGCRYVAACTDGLANVVPTEERFFDLAFKVRYAFSDPSTVILESLQFGQMTFCIDIADEQPTSIFRRFAGLCVSSAAEAAERVRAIEAGTWQYPLKALGDLVDLSGRVIFDVVREDLGLTPREQPRPLLHDTSAAAASDGAPARATSQTMD